MWTDTGGVPFCSVAKQAQVRGTLAVGRRLGWVLGVVEDIHLSIDRLGGYQEGVLRHIPCPIDLAFMIDLLDTAVKQESAKFDCKSRCSCPITLAHDKGLVASRCSDVPLMLLAELFKLKCLWSEVEMESMLVD